MMGITLEELKKLDKDTYSIIDIRDESDIDSGAMPGGNMCTCGRYHG